MEFFKREKDQYPPLLYPFSYANQTGLWGIKTTES